MAGQKLLAGELPADGTWTVTFRSADPTAWLDRTQEMPARAINPGDGSEGGTVAMVVTVVGALVLGLVVVGLWLLVRRSPEL